MTPDLRHRLGRIGEDLALGHRERRGYARVARSRRTRFGEIDLVVHDGTALVFCEVKTRRGTRFGAPAEAIGPGKVRRLRVLAARWLAQSSIRPREVRFDVVAVVQDGRGPFTVQHTRAAF